MIRVAVVLMMLRIGLDITPKEIAANARKVELVLWSFVANYVFVPALIVVLLLTVRAAPMVSVAFLIMSVCPGAPFVPPLTSTARGDVPFSVTLMALLAGSSAILTPLLLHFLLPYVSSSEPLTIDALGIFVLLAA